MIPRISRDHAIESVLSTTCPACGRSKPEARALCDPCLLRVPGTIYRGLCLRIGDGYEEALADALDFLGTPEMKLPPKRI